MPCESDVPCTLHIIWQIRILGTWIQSGFSAHVECRICNTFTMLKMAMNDPLYTHIPCNNTILLWQYHSITFFCLISLSLQDLREECLKLHNRVQELEQQNHNLKCVFDSRGVQVPYQPSSVPQVSEYQSNLLVLV